MGYILTPIVIDLGKVSALIGSRNEHVLAALCDDFAHRLRDIDDAILDARDEEAAGEHLTARAALTQMIMGGEYDKDFGFVYGFGLELICDFLGDDFLPNTEWSAMPRGTQWAATVDDELQKLGVPAPVLRVSDHLIFRGPPIPLPPIDDFPGIGFLKLEEIRRAKQALASVDFSSLKDAEVRTAITQVWSWLHTCAESNRDLVCFYG